MGETPSALLIGDAEVDRVERLLGQLGVDYERLPEPRRQLDVPSPSRLLVVSGRSLLNLPTPKSEDSARGDPVRVCIHNQDFLPLRARLREQGFHYLVQTSLDEPSLRAFFGQLLHSQFDRRSQRLPLGGKVEYRSDRVSGAARLADLSADGCRIEGVQGLAIDEPVTVLLPATLGGGSPLPLPGRVMRCGDESATSGGAAFAVIRFGVLDEDAHAGLDRIVLGDLVGARVTPLAQPPVHQRAASREAPPPALQGAKSCEAPPPAHQGAKSCEAPAPAAAAKTPDSAEQRREVRHPYHGRVDAIELVAGADGVLARDLSLDGISIAGAHRLKPGMRITLALYGGPGGEPTIVDAEVIRVCATESALVFGSLTDAQQDRLATLIAQPPALEALTPSAEGSRLIATQILERGE